MRKARVLYVSVCTALMLTSVPFPAAADEETYLYGTMEIPYAEFYRAELDGSVNEYEVDAVSSATTAKWPKNGEGDLFEGTYNEANEDETGTILGVVYPVALTKETLDALGESDYAFTELNAVPNAYKTVTVEDNTVSFSAVQGAPAVSLEDVTPSLGTETAWGDYLLSFEGLPEDIGILYGVVLKTDSGESYAMRHLENIWRNELAWSAGFVTQEPHGNTLTFENFKGLMGETISEIVFITAEGYRTLDTELYVPVKFNYTLLADDAPVTDGRTAVTLKDFPEDYNLTFQIDGLDAQISETEIVYADAAAGGYTLIVSDADGIYADVSADFVLTTDSMPAAFENDMLVKAEDAEDADFENFLKNLAVVTVNGTDYAAAGRQSVTIIGEDGSIDFTAVSRNAAIFDHSGEYEISVTATGYTVPLEFSVSVKVPEESASERETE